MREKYFECDFYADFTAMEIHEMYKNHLTRMQMFQIFLKYYLCVIEV